MFIKKLANEYAQLFISLLKILGLLLLCTILGAAVVYPLYLLATNFSEIYTWSILLLIALGIAIYLILKIKKQGILPFLRTFLTFVIISVGLFLSIYFVLNDNRIAALFTLIIAAVLWGFSRLLFKTEK